MRQGKRVRVVVGAVLGLVAARVAWAHPGRTNSAGCHNNRRTGDYHCHGGGSYSGGWSAPVEAPTRLQVVAIPRARVWINDQYVGLSPTRAIKVGSGSVKVRLEHVALGVHEVTTNAAAGETTELTVRW
ncbi:YHYH domain-containing protein [Pyxidicoccus fallax]|uniref:YHYH domain-containing protein n=1 Tax=Pyxidicoccus fallax TaxID=394095 RepID=A0A848LE84_9BACT|nr:YHYH domain-containing protein [Pyxidicoccus fallax]NMO17017.1 YHYH domain-containing protein [Pyxidicoccus fallax]NPC79432.1 YHYH domain-containing protein [Pyxidicoccus fallax]